MIPTLKIENLKEIQAGENFCGIYVCWCKSNGKYYLGSTISFKSRRQDHLKLLRKNKHHSSHFQFAWNKYYENNFVWLKIRDCKRENLEKIEQHYLNIFQPWNDEIGFNIARFVDSQSRGRKMSDETKRKISVARTGKKLSAEKRKSISDGKKGLPWTEKQKESNAKYQRSLKENNAPHHNKGRAPNQETRDKISAANSGENNFSFGRKKSPEEIQKQVEKMCQGQNYYFIRITDNQFFHTKNLREFCRLNNLEPAKRVALSKIWRNIPTKTGLSRFIEFTRATDQQIQKYLNGEKEKQNPVYFPDLPTSHQEKILKIRSYTLLGERSPMFSKNHSEESKAKISATKLQKNHES